MRSAHSGINAMLFSLCIVATLAGIISSIRKLNQYTLAVSTQHVYVFLYTLSASLYNTFTNALVDYVSHVCNAAMLRCAW